MNGNAFISWILRSPFHAMLSGGMALLTVTGRKTGNLYTTPIGYYSSNGEIWIMTSRNRTWWKNLRGGGQVSLLLKRSLVFGTAELELEETLVQARLVEYLQHVPQAARSLGIHMRGQMPDAQDLARVAAERLFVKIKIMEGHP